ncbi:MAG: T9SS type A sorting domain-containing protein [Bacteroidota bacterium]|nr:T9SS type A sorting domain-containing protein [Bacteroidota bacterium]
MAVLLFLAADAHAQAFVTQNKFVAALVYSGSTGKVTFTQVVNGKAVVAQGAHALSFQDYSYLSIMVNGQYCTNNTVPQPTLATSLLGGASHLLKPDINLDNGTTRKINDTIETIWHEGGFDIVQDVYPVAFATSGQIVLKVKVIDHTGTSYGALGQYLLDVCAGTNDDAYMLDQYTYESNNTWKIYNSGSPMYYMGFEHDTSTGGGGTVGAGYTTDMFAPAPMGLTACSGMVFGDSKVLDTYTFGAPAAPGSNTSPIDAAVLMQWPYLTVHGNNGIDSVTEVFRTSYGTRPGTTVDTTPMRGNPVIAVQSRTDSCDGSICNARVTYILATDTNTPPLGFAGATTLSATNMSQIIWAPPHAINVLPIAVHVLDSMLDGQIVLRIVGNDSSVTLDTITYCTIPDTHPPVTRPESPDYTRIHITDSDAWDRGLDSIYVTEVLNVVTTPTLPIVGSCTSAFDVTITPRAKGSYHCLLHAVDCAGHSSVLPIMVDFGEVSSSEVTSSILHIHPNPSADIFTIDVGQASPLAQAEVLDVLGRTVARFSVQGTTTFDASTLPAGTYIVRVEGMSGRMVKE